MPWWETAIFFVSILLFFTLIHLIGKNKRPFKRALLSFFVGAGTLLAVNLTSVFTGVYLPVSLLTVIVSVAGGIPGVTLLLALNLFF